DDNVVFEAFKAGAEGYLLKSQISPNDLWMAVQDLLAGGAPMSPAIARKVILSFQHHGKLPAVINGLSSRENEVLEILARGLLYKEVADKLDISIDTVKKHAAAIYR